MRSEWVDLYTNPEDGIDDYQLQIGHDYRATLVMYGGGGTIEDIKFSVSLPETISAGKSASLYLGASDADSDQSLMLARLYLSADEDVRIDYIDNTARYTSPDMTHEFNNDETIKFFDRSQRASIGNIYGGANNAVTVSFDFRVSAVE